MKTAWASHQKIPFFYRTMNLISWALFRFFFRFKVYGQDNIIPGPAIIAANHVSYLDPPVLGIACPEEVHYLARESLFKIPIFGYLIRKINSYPLRGGGGDFAVLKTVIALLDQKKKVILFPEGQRSHNDELLGIKPGLSLLVSKANAPVIPAYIFGTYKAWPRKNLFPKLFVKIGCIFGEPIFWEEFKNLEKKEAKIAFANKLTMAIKDLKKIYEEMRS